MLLSEFKSGDLRLGMGTDQHLLQRKLIPLAVFEINCLKIAYMISAKLLARTK